MAAMEVEVIDTTVQKTYTWLKEIAETLGTTDRHRAYRALRAVLHALRDRLPVDEAAQLGAQLPMLVRGIYYEGWDPSHKPLKERHKEEFLAHIRRDFRDEPAVDAEQLARAVFTVLSRRVTEGEIEDVKHILPKELRELWP
jgi:uncharacterized protein (DUF2267 family)